MDLLSTTPQMTQYLAIWFQIALMPAAPVGPSVFFYIVPVNFPSCSSFVVYIITIITEIEATLLLLYVMVNIFITHL